MADCKILYEKNTPKIYVAPDAMFKMRYYIDNTDMEIGWLGYVSKLDDTSYLIEDVFLLKQKVHSATTEIDPEALATLATELIRQGDEGIAKYNKIRMWGHSHVNMSTGASGQDDSQMNDFATNDFYIRLIGNKRGEWNVCLYDYTNNVLWSGLSLQLYYTSSVNPEDLAKEIEDNVSKITFNTPSVTPWVGGRRRNFYFDDDDYYDSYFPSSYKKQLQAERLADEKEKEEEEEEIPYEIVGRPQKQDYRHMKKYYSSDENTCLYMWTAGEEEVEDVIYEDYGVHLTREEVKDFMKEMQDIYERKFCGGVVSNEL